MSFELPPTWYRTRFLIGVAETLLPPFALTYVLLTAVFGSAGAGFVATLAYISSIPVWITVTSWYSVWKNDRRARQLGATPIPRAKGKWPGNLDIMMRFAKDLREGYILQAMGEVLDEHGVDTLNTRILWKDNIITRDDLHMRAVHQVQFESFERGAEAAEKMGTFLGRGVFVTDRTEWRRERALIRPFLNKERISDFDIFQEHSDRALSILSSSVSTHEPIDLQDLFARFTLDAASSFLLGTSPDALGGPRPVPYKAKIGSKGAATEGQLGTFLYAFEEIQVTISLRWRLNTFFPLYEIKGDHTMPHVDVIMKWVKPTVEQALERKKREREQGIERQRAERTMLENLVEITQDEERVRYGLLNVLMAGRDTTAGLLTYVVYLLTIYPAVAKRLREEIFDICGANGSPTHDLIRKMPYMNAVLNETLRLFPPAPMGIRNSMHQVLLPAADGEPPLYLPGKARVTWLTLPLHRRKDLWGEDADEFDPDRWLDPKRLARVEERPSMFVPFLSGPRSCPGQNFALNEASFMLVRLLQRFSGFELVPEATPEGARPPRQWKEGKGRQRIEQVWPSTAFTAFVKGGLWVRPVP
ncbi:cytochrome P450 monooxygenase CYP63 [Fomitopsis serialis]|uniref:cytochrome P450 monooxygenase CYP63 n=1 Tax=Fomitopsis serialis TaxID=139415 RepID=UPI0020085938|nr:cytochrome P450 monooxygenase CYP63 [Neoantrodia serialis]KAH9921357.1 cytochrome P450 monooxygenase CYP63 [Neoantrodia serialis]